MKIQPKKRPLSNHALRAWIIAFLGLFVTQNITAQTYCAAKGISPWQEWIANVQFGTINNASQKEGYGNFTSQTTDLARFTNYPLSITQGFSWAPDPSNQTQQGLAWIDYNQNGVFETAETVASFTRTITLSNIVVPINALNGRTRMRIALKTSGFPTSCETFEKGEVEDYTVNILGGTGGGNAPDLTISNVNFDDAVSPNNNRVNIAVAGVLNYKVDVKNIGTGSATGNFSIKSYLSRDRTLSADDIQDGTIATGNYQAGFSNLQVAAASRIPVNINGEYYLIMKIDADNQVTEDNETNNVVVSAQPFQVNQTPTTPYLTITNVVELNEPEASGLLNVTITIRNPSTANSVRDTIRLVRFKESSSLGSYTIQDYSDSGIDVIVPPIAAGQELTFTENFYLPFTLKSFGGVYVEPYFALNSRLNGFGFSSFYPAAERFSKFGYLLPIVYRKNADVSITNAVVLDGTYNKIDPSVSFSFTVRNAGPNMARNILVELESYLYRVSPQALGSQLYDLRVVNVSGIIDASYISNDINYKTFYAQIGALAAGESINLTITAKVSQNIATNDVDATFNRVLKIGYGEYNDANTANNQTGILTFTRENTPPSSSCFNRFELEGLTAGICERTNPFSTSTFGNFQQFGSNIADGFKLGVVVAGNFSELFARNGTTTRPSGARFVNCPANWTYFSAEGGTIRNNARSTNVELDNIFVRVRTYGNATNPDSIGVEIDSSFTAGQFGLDAIKLVSVRKSTICNPCWATDRTPPTYTNCPTTVVNYPLSSPTSPFSTRTLTAFFNISTSDNCSPSNSGNTIEYAVPNNFFADWKGVYDIKLIRFDSAGNKGVCNFRVRMPNPPCSVVTTPPTFNNCPANIAVQAAAGQTCAAATWTPPTATSSGYPIPLSISSNFASGHCFPIGTTAVVYTATDSCNNVSTCTFNVVVTGGTTGGGNYCASKGTAPWEYAISNVQIGTINNTSEKFKDFSTLGYSDFTNVSTTLNKGTSYPLSITPLLSWIGNVPNAYCRVWIDFNQNKTFEANELVLEKTNANPLTQSVLIPTTALAGATRMRVSLKNGAYPTACETFEKGEVEDYTITIGGGTTNNNCLNIYELSSFNPLECNRTSDVQLSEFGVAYQLGTNITDGFYLVFGSSANFRAQVFAKNGTSAAPAGSNFRNCTGNWVYFTAEGGNESGNTDGTQTEIPRLFVRAKAFGNAQNPDSIYIEIDGSNGLARTMVSTSKRQDCAACYATDRTPPTISNCPTSLVNYQLDGPEIRFRMANVLRQINLSSTDNCTSIFAPVNYTFPNVRSVSIGQTYDVKYVAYDIAGNKATCAFQVKMVNTTVNQPDLTISNLVVPSTTVQVGAGRVLGFTFDVGNNSTVAVPNVFRIKSYFSTDQTLSANDLVRGDFQTGNYNAGFSVNVGNSIDATIPEGQYYLIVKIDADNEIAESNENNNIVVSPLLTMVSSTGGGGGSDIALSITSTPSVYRQYTTQNFRITANNSGTTAFSNVKIKFTRPALTVAGGTKVASIGTFSDYCPGGLECSEWTIPTLAGGTTATLDIPLFVLNPTAAITASANLLSSNPVDNSTGNNTASVTINSANAPIISPLDPSVNASFNSTFNASFNSLINSKPTALNPVIIHKINPTIADNFIVIESESYLNKSIDYQIVNALGTAVSMGKLILEKGINKQHIDVSQLPKGMYFIAINGRLNKFIKI